MVAQAEGTFRVRGRSAEKEAATESAGPGGYAEVLIVGAGPAGLACAIAAARQGLQVEVVDGMSPPIDKACGEGLMPDALESLAALGFDLDKFIDPSQCASMKGIRFLSGDIAAQASFPAEAGRGIRRTVLHAALLECAVQLGVGFSWSTSVQGIEPGPDGVVVCTNRQSFRCRYLVGADGLRSQIAKWSGLAEGARITSHRFCMRQHYCVAPWSDFVEVYWSDWGQAYVTPISATEVCVAFTADRKLASPEVALRGFPLLEERLGGAERKGTPRGAVTVIRTLRSVATGSIALVGDASGAVDTVTGEGMALSFRYAAALVSAIRAGDLARYHQAHRRIQRLPTLMSRVLLLLGNSPRLRAIVFRILEKCPWIFAGLLRVHVGA